MANQVDKVNGVAIASLEKFGGKTDSNIEKLNGLTFSGASYFAATGGTKSDITIDGVEYTMHVFSASGTLNITALGDDNPSFLVVGGGGSGGADNGGGGGAGGALFNSATTSTNSNSPISSLFTSVGGKTVTVGAGGADSGGADGNVGGNSALAADSATYTANGGGAGTASSNSADASGSAGGAGAPGGVATRTGGDCTTNQGNDGGNAFSSHGSYPNRRHRGGGGGGAGSQGDDTDGGTGSDEGDGGAGIDYSGTFGTGVGDSGWFAGGGGGGGVSYNYNGGQGGQGGGGDGDKSAPAGSAGGKGSAGTDGTGGGAGGSGNGQGGSGAGGDGVVIVRYLKGGDAVTEGHTFIASATASSDSSLSFTSHLDDTYDVYEFHFINIHPATGGERLTFQMDSGSGYATTMTTTNFLSEQAENDSGTALTYRTIRDQAQGTSYQPITGNIYNNNDDSGSGILRLYAPSSSTYVKHFTSVANVSGNGFSDQNHVAGYFNTTSALTRISFAMSSGNIDAGEIRMYGVATS